MTDCIVVGGGISGFASAVRLASQRFHVTLIESRPRCGGRAYAFTDTASGERLDNGQHIMMGCYTEMLAFLSAIGAAQKLTPVRNMRVPFISSNGNTATLQALRLPYPFDSLSAFLGYKLLTFSERLSLLRVVAAAKFISRKRLASLDTITVHQWLSDLHQGPRAISCLWEPIVLATMNARLDEASAFLFATVLREAFLGGKEAATFLLPGADLSSLYVDESVAYLQEHRCAVRTHTRVDRIEKTSEGYRVICGPVEFTAAAIILAVPHAQLIRIADASPGLELPIMTQDIIAPSEIVSIHIWSRKQFTRELMTGFIGTTLQWLFAKGESVTDTWRYSGVISAANSIRALPTPELEQRIQSELFAAYPELEPGDIVRMKTIREGSATFLPVPGLERIRNAVPKRAGGIAIAGDWTGTSLPATLEGAVRSGHAAAKEIRVFLASFSDSENT